METRHPSRHRMAWTCAAAALLFAVPGIGGAWFGPAAEGARDAQRDLAQGRYQHRDYGEVGGREYDRYTSLLMARYGVAIWNGGCIAPWHGRKYNEGYNAAMELALQEKFGRGFAELSRECWDATQNESSVQAGADADRALPGENIDTTFTRKETDGR